MCKKLICCFCGHNQDETNEVYQDVYFPNRMVRVQGTDALIKCEECNRYEDMIIFGEALMNLLGKEGISDSNKELIKESNRIYINGIITNIENDIAICKTQNLPLKLTNLERKLAFNKQSLLINEKA